MAGYSTAPGTEAVAAPSTITAPYSAHYPPHMQNGAIFSSPQISFSAMEILTRALIRSRHPVSSCPFSATEALTEPVRRNSRLAYPNRSTSHKRYRWSLLARKNHPESFPHLPEPAYQSLTTRSISTRPDKHMTMSPQMPDKAMTTRLTS